MIRASIEARYGSGPVRGGGAGRKPEAGTEPLGARCPEG
jgi:hypothetical protein